MLAEKVTGQSYSGNQEYNLIISEITPALLKAGMFDYTSGNLPSGVKDSFFELWLNIHLVGMSVV